MNLVERIHDRHVKSRRVDVLAGLLAPLLPERGSVLDVGAGDGALAAELMRRKPGLTIEGIDTLVRPVTAIPVAEFDGVHIDVPGGVDWCLFVDVIHHVERPMELLRSAVAVARKGLIIKDHLRQGVAAYTTLRFMDSIGNARYGVSLPCNYWTPRQWDACCRELKLRRDVWLDRLPVYPPPANWIFGRRLHVVARLTHENAERGHPQDA